MFAKGCLKLFIPIDLLDCEIVGIFKPLHPSKYSMFFYSILFPQINCEQMFSLSKQM